MITTLCLRRAGRPDRRKCLPARMTAHRSTLIRSRPLPVSPAHASVSCTRYQAHLRNPVDSRLSFDRGVHACSPTATWSSAPGDVWAVIRRLCQHQAVRARRHLRRPGLRLVCQLRLIEKRNSRARVRDGCPRLCYRSSLAPSLVVMRLSGSSHAHPGAREVQTAAELVLRGAGQPRAVDLDPVAAGPHLGQAWAHVLQSDAAQAGDLAGRTEVLGGRWAAAFPWNALLCGLRVPRPSGNADRGSRRRG